MDKKLFESLVCSMEEMLLIEKGEFLPLSENVHLHIVSVSEEAYEAMGLEDTLHTPNDERICKL
jgi:putative transcriptional regulator